MPAAGYDANRRPASGARSARADGGFPCVLLLDIRAGALLVSRGLGAVGLPWRFGADPEAVLVRIDPPE